MAGIAFYDAHFHALTLSHPSFLSFIDTLRNRRLENLYAQFTAPNYLATALFSKGGERMRNMLSVMENDVASIFALMEDDLRGLYAKPGDARPLVVGDELVMGRLVFDKVVIVPLIMDFETPGRLPSDSYYNKPPSKPVALQVREILSGIRDYRLSRPGGLLEIRPFLGINTRNHDPASLASLLEGAFGGYRRGEAAASKAFLDMAGFDLSAPATPDLCFAGVKVYPPLGFDPWPEEDGEREKVQLLYSFCEARGIPMITHCDDQGFRVIGLEDSWTWAAPSRWRHVLEAHPRLCLDFAHFGAQYSHPIGRTRSLGQALGLPTEWRDAIVDLMGEYPGVYTDISFNGTEASYYEGLIDLLSGLPRAMGELVSGRILFGSDFMVNLTKIRSYADYYRVFEGSNLPDEWKRRFCHDNPKRFLTGD